MLACFHEVVRQSYFDSLGQLLETLRERSGQVAQYKSVTIVDIAYGGRVRDRNLR
ncbi:hypothetical protein [Nostoc sp.]|uniref:hypothetical protein n=1 Tax=Nostoc sp. TaxID=1180 RepID=UPI002FF87130